MSFYAHLKIICFIVNILVKITHPYHNTPLGIIVPLYNPNFKSFHHKIFVLFLEFSLLYHEMKTFSLHSDLKCCYSKLKGHLEFLLESRRIHLVLVSFFLSFSSGDVGFYVVVYLCQ